MLVLCVVLKVEVEEISGHNCLNDTFQSKHLSSYHLCCEALALVDREFCASEFLIARLIIFVLFI